MWPPLPMAYDLCALTQQCLRPFSHRANRASCSRAGNRGNPCIGRYSTPARGSGSRNHLLRLCCRRPARRGICGALPVPKRHLGHILVSTYILSGILILPFGFLKAMWLAASIVIVIGVMGEYTNIIFTTWLQARTPQKMLGRVMSLLMIASIGLSPISNAVSGPLIKLSLGWVFVGAGAMTALLSVTAGLRRAIVEMEMP